MLNSRGSSIGRAFDCRSNGRWFDSGPRDLIRVLDNSKSHFYASLAQLVVAFGC